jgi:xanthine dehydrogenase accessory factor
MIFSAPSEHIIPDFSKDPVNALLKRGGEGVLAVIIGVEGPSYRPLGAIMAILSDGTRIGSLSSGCVEADLAVHAQQILITKEPKRLRYGKNSTFFDIQLPCGGGLDILLIPYPDIAILSALNAQREERNVCVLGLDIKNGNSFLARMDRPTGLENSIFYVRFVPPIQFLVFGKGPEASTFASLVNSINYPNILISPDSETLQWAQQVGVKTEYISTAMIPKQLQTDRWTAIILFFHDHSWEPDILSEALKTHAFYIGAQGSRKARDQRYSELRKQGVAEIDIARLHGPIGLIPSARNARTLAISVLAEVLQVAN